MGCPSREIAAPPRNQKNRCINAQVVETPSHLSTTYDPAGGRDGKCEKRQGNEN